MIVVDASLATKWLLVEPDSREATAFLRQNKGRLHAPDLLVVEVAAALVRAANINKEDAPDMLRGLARWAGPSIQQRIELHRTTAPLIAAAGALAIRLGHPLKDCIYLVLAERLDCELATCDIKFRNRAVTSFPRIRLLADYANLR